MKKITFKNNGGSYKVIDVIGDPNNETWGKIKGQTIWDFQFKGICADLKHDKYKIEVV